VPDLLLDDVSEELIAVLERRAARNGRTPEEEHRQILIEALCVGFSCLDRDEQ